MKLSVCVDALFIGKDFYESLKKLTSIGVKNIEFHRWWDKDTEKIKAVKDELDLDVTAFCTKFISLVDAFQREEYIKGLKETIERAKYLRCKTLITQVGADTGAKREEQETNLVEGLKTCVPLLEKEDIMLVFEPLNTLVDHKGYYLYSSEEAFRIADQVNSPKVKVLYDIYHQQITEGHLIKRITKNIDKIGHFHAAGNPGRHELYFGEINYSEVFKAIDETGYTGSIGLEYFPIEEPEKGIKAYL